jgi:peptidoglycan/LPS O-acetylase OafA/YrhL
MTESPLGHRARLPGIEALRGYAAFAILIFHVIHMTNAAVPQSLEFMKVFLAYGVPLFFVISAFSLAYPGLGRSPTSICAACYGLRRSTISRSSPN